MKDTTERPQRPKRESPSLKVLHPMRGPAVYVNAERVRHVEPTMDGATRIHYPGFNFVVQELYHAVQSYLAPVEPQKGKGRLT